MPMHSLIARQDGLLQVLIKIVGASPDGRSDYNPALIYGRYLIRIFFFLGRPKRVEYEHSADGVQRCQNKHIQP